MSHLGSTKGAVGLSPKADDDNYDHEEKVLDLGNASPVPSLCGIPLKYLSLATLAIQNSTLTIIMHHSRVSASPSRTYSAATAVLMSELLKGLISLAFVFARVDPPIPRNYDTLQRHHDSPHARSYMGSFVCPWSFCGRLKRVFNEVFSQDCWKLSIPAVLYVIQNHLQFVAISNLEAATFQVSYQLKILTTAAFSVLLLRKQLSSVQWFSLALLAIGVGVVQIQSSTGGETTVSSLALGIHKMNQMKGLIAVIAACFTSGLAGVYFEMVLKNSPADLWTRNVQLSLFSLLPALSPIILSYAESSSGNTPWTIASIFHNFGVWAWATVLAQVAGGLVTALVIKYADNILKGFATSLSIVMSFLASVALFDFGITTTFLLGSVMVLVATWLYNQPQRGGNGTLKIIRMGRDVRSRGEAFFSPMSCNDETVCMHSLSTPRDQDSLEPGWDQKPISRSSSFGDVRSATPV